MPLHCKTMRLNVSSAIALAGLLLLSGCKRAGALPSDEVLRRAVAAGAQVSSAQFNATTEFFVRSAAGEWKGNAKLTGTVSNGGKQSDVKVTLGVTLASANPQTINGEARIISDALERYFTILSLSADPQIPIVTQMQEAVGTWWHTSTDSPATQHQNLAPDPVMLKAQASVVKVLEDYGLKRVRGKDAYHFRVAIDPEKLKMFSESLPEADATDAEELRAKFSQYDVTGSLWIEEDSFHLLRAEWSVKSVSNDALRLNIVSDFDYQNAAMKVLPPENFQELHGKSFMDFLPTLPKP